MVYKLGTRKRRKRHMLDVLQVSGLMLRMRGHDEEVNN